MSKINSRKAKNFLKGKKRKTFDAETDTDLVLYHRHDVIEALNIAFGEGAGQVLDLIDQGFSINLMINYGTKNIR